MAIVVDMNTEVVCQGFAGAGSTLYSEQAIAYGTRRIEGAPDTLGRGRTMLACLLASLATPALAQPAADLAAPEAVAAFVMETCVYETPTPELSEDAIQAAGFALTESGEETVEFAAPDGSTLALGARGGTFASCELRLPDRSEAFFDALAQAMSAAVGERYPVADLETLEDGMMWRLEPAPELYTQTELSRLENGDVLVVSATEVGRVPLGYE